MTVAQLPTRLSRPSIRLPGRSMAIWAGAVLAVLLTSQVVLPALGDVGGTPIAILLRGALTGLVNAMTAAGVVLIFRTLRIVNFAQTAIGGAGGLLIFLFVQLTDTPFAVAFPLGIALGGLAGFAVGLVTLRFSQAPRITLTVVTIVLGGFIGGIATKVASLPFFPPLAEQDPLLIFDIARLRSRLPYPGLAIHVGTFPTPFGFSEVFSAEVAIVSLVGLGLFLRFSRAGIRLRSLAENPERAGLLGVGVGGLSCLVWAIAGTMSAASVTLTGMLTTPAAVIGIATSVLLSALAAAVLGRFRSLPRTVAAAVGIGIVTEAVLWNRPDDRPLLDLGLFVLVAGGLLLQKQDRSRARQASESSTWASIADRRPLPTVLATLPGFRRAKLLGVIVVGGVLALFPFVASTGSVNRAGTAALGAITVLSLVVLTGWAGQVSLGQAGFVGLGAAVAGSLTSKVGIPFWFAVPIAVAVVAAIAVVVGLPALRYEGLLLLVVTFFFGAAVQSVALNPRYARWLIPVSVDRPSLPFVSFESERSMYFLCIAALGLSLLLVRNLRRGRIGRLLLAARDNEAALAACAVDTTRTKLLAFAVSGGLAGFSGAVAAHQQRGVTAGSFSPTSSINLFLTAVFGGIGSAPGALLGTAWFKGLETYGASAIVASLLGGGVTLLILFAAPGGVVSIVDAARDSALGLAARRRGIVVAGFTGDADDGAAALAPELPGAGLAALGSPEFSLPSRVHLDPAVEVGS